ncbi:MAG: bifunctional ornithine acetyltransferase/N-acetylglutamate synthase protein [Verrucomicrobia bacterium ADurb.Bin474]|nr:MAG: bifunctional ornithine acetyltransferase/N-acetylglutamate synthase protein [Verrucomicrobia bacterium ADurb.Bin474]
MSMYYDTCPVVKNGGVIDANLSEWRKIVSKKEFSIILDLGMGMAEARLLASDLTPEYIEFNMHE